MSTYDFRSLSPHDFENLCRDLLQEHLKLHLESFSPGPDSGIDFRHCRKGLNLIVQCKHYIESGFAKLLSALRHHELPKIKQLAPTRYILTTSVRLTPQRKDDLLAVLSPYCSLSADIYGQEDINALLNAHSQVEETHFKLWLTRTTVLRRIVDAGIFGDSQAHLTQIRRRLARYVPNDSYPRAKSALDTRHFCIIAGIPGIGKTTLAEVLLADLVDRQKFTPFRVSHDISELRAIKNKKSRQVFYFDDFLGRTGVTDLRRNEDQRLVELLAEVQENPQWRFVLTTREYILNAARQRYEAFAYPPVDWSLCTVALRDYTRPIRAQILYNHLYFSDLSTKHKVEILTRKAYEAILTHRNYNPRVLQYMTEGTRNTDIPHGQYRTQFLANLDNPTRIWEHAFRNQISQASRNLLLVLATLPDETYIDDVKDAFWSLHHYRRTRYGFATKPDDWMLATKELDGNFITTRRDKEHIVISFANPSIKDFLEQDLVEVRDDVVDLLSSFHFYDQYRILWRGSRDRRYPGIDQNGDVFLKALKNSLDAPTVRCLQYVSGSTNTVEIRIEPTQYSMEDRAEFLVQVADSVQGPIAVTVVESVLGRMRQRWTKEDANRQDLLRLLKRLVDRGLRPNEPLFVAARHCLLTEGVQSSDFAAAAQFCAEYPAAVREKDHEALGGQLLKFASELAIDEANDTPDALREMAVDLEGAADQFGVGIDDTLGELEATAQYIEEQTAYEPDYDDEDRDWSPRVDRHEDEAAMFANLRNMLREG